MKEPNHEFDINIATANEGDTADVENQDVDRFATGRERMHKIQSNIAETRSKVSGWFSKKRASLTKLFDRGKDLAGEGAAAVLSAPELLGEAKDAIENYVGDKVEGAQVATAEKALEVSANYEKAKEDAKAWIAEQRQAAADMIKNKRDQADAWMAEKMQAAEESLDRGFAKMDAGIDSAVYGTRDAFVNMYNKGSEGLERARKTASDVSMAAVGVGLFAAEKTGETFAQAARGIGLGFRNAQEFARESIDQASRFASKKKTGFFAKINQMKLSFYKSRAEANALAVADLQARMQENAALMEQLDAVRV